MNIDILPGGGQRTRKTLVCPGERESPSKVNLIIGHNVVDCQMTIG